MPLSSKRQQRGSADLRRIQEHLCSQLNRVVERDSSSAYCGPSDLYTALAEDERFWGWFSRMQGKRLSGSC